MSIGRKNGFLDYVKAAFTWRWNMLAFGGGVAFSLLSPVTGVVLPLVLASEILYLGMLSTRPKFQKAIDARAYADRTMATRKVPTSDILKEMKTGLKPEAWQRFESLRERCLSLDHLARQFRGLNLDDQSKGSELQTASLERLLWMFLKLLYSVDALNRFLKGIYRDDLAAQLAATEKDLKSAQDNKRADNVVKSLQDKLATLHQRLENYDRAKDNRDFLSIELDRIEQKVSAISEMSINSKDATDFSAQVDGITDGIAATEQAMRTLDVAPILTQEDAPPLLQREEPPPIVMGDTRRR